MIHFPPPAVEIPDALPRLNDDILPGLNGGHLSYQRRAWAQIRDAAGLPWLREHDCRHSLASVALAAGATLDQIGELLGHRSVQTTRRYAHLLDDTARRTVGRVGALVAEWSNGGASCAKFDGVPRVARRPPDARQARK